MLFSEFFPIETQARARIYVRMLEFNPCNAKIYILTLCPKTLLLLVFPTCYDMLKHP